MMASETLEDKKQEEIANVEDKGEVKEEGKTEEGEEEKEAEKKEEDTEMAEKEEEDEEKEEPEVKGEESKEEAEEVSKKAKRGRKGSSKKAAKDEKAAKSGPGSKEPVTPIERPIRERKTAERYSEPSTGRSASKALSIEKGQGTQLKDIPNAGEEKTNVAPNGELETEAKVVNIPSSRSMEFDAQTMNDLPEVEVIRMCKVLGQNANESMEAFLANKPAGFKLKKNLLLLKQNVVIDQHQGQILKKERVIRLLVKSFLLLQIHFHLRLNLYVQPMELEMMGCFFGCFRIRDDHRHPQTHLASEPLPSKLRNPLSSLLLADDKDGFPCKDEENPALKTPEHGNNNGELKDEVGIIPVGHNDGGLLALKAAQSSCFTKFCQWYNETETVQYLSSSSSSNGGQIGATTEGNHLSLSMSNNQQRPFINPPQLFATAAASSGFPQ
ncbi:unnamed protein product [Camellia sinensis]